MTEEQLEAEVALLAAETDYVAELVTRGILPEGARREPSAQELRAGVRFAELDRIVVDAAGLIVRATIPVRAHLLEVLAPTLTTVTPASAGPYAVVEVLTDLTPDEVPGLTPIIATALHDVVTQLEAVAQAGADEALGEAARQGVKALPTVDAGTVEVHDAAVAHGSRVITAAVNRLLEVALEAAGRAATAPSATAADVIDAATAAATATDEKL